MTECQNSCKFIFCQLVNQIYQLYVDVNNKMVLAHCWCHELLRHFRTHLWTDLLTEVDPFSTRPPSNVFYFFQKSLGDLHLNRASVFTSWTVLNLCLRPWHHTTTETRLSSLTLTSLHHQEAKFEWRCLILHVALRSSCIERYEISTLTKTHQTQLG